MKHLKHSIKLRISLTLAAMIMLIIFVCWFANKTLLAQYYTQSKVDTLGSSYKDINKAYNTIIKNNEENNNYSEDDNTTMEESSEIEWERLTSNKNLSLYIFENIKINIPGFTKIIPIFKYPASANEDKDKKELLSERISKYYNNLESNNNEMKLLASSDKYDIYRVFDSRIKSYYIELFGTLDNGDNIYMRSNFETILESANIANKFLAYVGIIVTIIGTIIMMFISNSLTRPILELSDIAKKMSDLNFDVKYPVKTQDEIGTLGNSINMLSQKLETTISELKTANNELLSDIENKTQIDEVRKEFLSNVSHELKTPIALIQGYAEGLKENVNDDEENRNFYCEVIMDEADKMNKMVKKLLTLNQLECGNNAVSIERFDIIEIIKVVLNSTEILFSQKNVSLEFDKDRQINVWADEYMIEEVVTNYISNALNHISGDNKIKIWTFEENGIVRISIFNTGNQIPEEEIEKIWIKFYKVDKARTREYGGNGIGLSIVKAIMTSLNRECGVINHEDGVEFWFELDCKN